MLVCEVFILTLAVEGLTSKNMEICQCSGCGKQLSVNSICRHKKKSCKAKNQQGRNETLALKAYDNARYEDEQNSRSKNPKLTTSVINNLINTSLDKECDDSSIDEDKHEHESNDETMNIVQGEGNENNNESDNDEDNEHISKNELKARLYTSSNIMKVFELKLVADRALSNIELVYYDIKDSQI